MKLLKKFYEHLLATFARAKFNYNSEKFIKLYDFNPAIFFNDTLSYEIMINGIYEKDELDLLSNIIDKEKYSLMLVQILEIIRSTLEIALKKSILLSHTQKLTNC